MENREKIIIFTLKKNENGMKNIIEWIGDALLKSRVMEQAEWIIMPKAIDLIANGRVKVVDNKVIIQED